MLYNMTDILKQTWRLDTPTPCASRKSRAYTRTRIEREQTRTISILRTVNTFFK